MHVMQNADMISHVLNRLYIVPDSPRLTPMPKRPPNTNTRTTFNQDTTITANPALFLKQNHYLCRASKFHFPTRYPYTSLTRSTLNLRVDY